jgi:hypothetical protein
MRASRPRTRHARGSIIGARRAARAPGTRVAQSLEPGEPPAHPARTWLNHWSQVRRPRTRHARGSIILHFTIGVGDHLSPSTRNLPRATFNAQPSTCNLQRATFNAQPSTCNLPRATFNVQPSTRNLQRATFNVQLSTRYLPPATFNSPPLYPGGTRATSAIPDRCARHARFRRSGRGCRYRTDARSDRYGRRLCSCSAARMQPPWVTSATRCNGVSSS